MVSERELIKAFELKSRNGYIASLIPAIGILSMINCLASIFKLNLDFYVGIETITVLKIFVFEFIPAEYLAMASAGIVMLSLTVAAWVIWTGIRAYLEDVRAYNAIIALYIFDTFALVFFQMYVQIVLHLIIIWGLFFGKGILKKLGQMQEANDKLIELLYYDEVVEKPIESE